MAMAGAVQLPDSISGGRLDFPPASWQKVMVATGSCILSMVASSIPLAKGRLVTLRGECSEAGPQRTRAENAKFAWTLRDREKRSAFGVVAAASADELPTTSRRLVKAPRQPPSASPSRPFLSSRQGHCATNASRMGGRGVPMRSGIRRPALAAAARRSRGFPCGWGRFRRARSD
jgi:hypothetical protein